MVLFFIYVKVVYVEGGCVASRILSVLSVLGGHCCSERAAGECDTVIRRPRGVEDCH